MNFIFLMDPLHTVIMEKDTTFALMLGAHRRGHKVYFLPDGGMSQKNSKLQLHVVDVTPQQNARTPFIENQSLVLSEGEIDVLFIRNDPPFDEQYLINTWLLDALSQTKPIINNPAGIRAANEKLWATQFTSLIPTTLVSRNQKDITSFLNEEKNIVAKPTDGHGGKSVFHVRENDRNAKVILETLTDSWQKEIVLQKYIPEAQKGDKRILLLDGEPLGAVLRLHAEDDHRNNFFSGGKPLAVSINKRDLEIIEHIKPALRNLGLSFVGIDILGEYLVEVNVTSPTCLQEMNALYDQHLEERVIAFAEKCVDQKRSNDTILNGCRS